MVNPNNIQKLDDLKNGKLLVLSGSMVSTFKECERKFLYSYVLKKEVDSDYIKPKYFNFGSAFHEIMEVIEHKQSKFKMDILNEISSKYNLDPVYEKAKLIQCVETYLKNIQYSNITIVLTELYFNDSSSGTIDAVGIDVDGFWIIDLKTASSLSNLRVEMLSIDPQMTLYASHSNAIKTLAEEKLGYDIGKFKGIKLREVSKASERKKTKPETLEEFYGRLKPNQYRETTIPASALSYDEIRNFMRIETKRANEMVKDFIDSNDNINCVPRNVRACSNPITKEVCPFFNSCHGKSAKEIMLNEKELNELANELDF